MENYLVLNIIMNVLFILYLMNIFYLRFFNKIKICFLLGFYYWYLFLLILGRFLFVFFGEWDIENFDIKLINNRGDLGFKYVFF